MEIECRQYEYGSADYKIALALRTKVLRDPLGLKFDPADLARESGSFHFGAYEGKNLVGTLILAPVEDDAESLKMRQVAVDDSVQSKGVGKALVKFSEHFARQNGFKRIELHARDTAVPFYLALGYEKFGEMFYEVTIPHLEMIKVL